MSYPQPDCGRSEAVPIQHPPILNKLDAITNMISDLEESVRMLEDKLVPVLSPPDQPMPGADKIQKEGPMESTISTQMGHFIDRLGVLHYQINNLRHRTEL